MLGWVLSPWVTAVPCRTGLTFREPAAALDVSRQGWEALYELHAADWNQHQFSDCVGPRGLIRALTRRVRTASIIIL